MRTAVFGRVLTAMVPPFDAQGGMDEDGIAAWIVLLSRGCGDPLLREVMDDLGDYGATVPLSAILDRILSRQRLAIDSELVMYLRDIALDNGDHRLAARSQTGIVQLRPELLLEQEILGRIQATGGDLAAAKGTLSVCLAAMPDHPDAIARLNTLGTAAFAPFAINRGFGSLPVRTDLRQHRRGVQLDYPRRRAGRIPAVDV